MVHPGCCRHRVDQPGLEQTTGMILALVTYLMALGCIAATLLPLSRHEAWWIRACDFPRLQIVAASGVVFAALIATGAAGDIVGRLLAAALLGCVAYQLAVILPYTRLWRVEVPGRSELPVRGAAPGERTLSLLVVNVLMSNRQGDELLGLIRGHEPDLVLAVETDRWWCDVLAALQDYRFRLGHPLDNTYGLLLLSRLELVEPELRFLLKPDVPSVRSGVRLRSGEVITLYGLHPEPPAPAEAETSLPRDAELILVAHEVAERSGPTVVAGDLNDVAWSHTSRLFRRISRLLDPRVGRGMFNSFHAGHRLLRWPLDHVFVSDDFLLRDMQRLPAFGSDHFPILIRLDHEPRAVEVAEPPEADADDHAEADRKLEQVGSSLPRAAPAMGGR
jgi:endonuclease/exonuclease/phosphatase (EEP) superfamily protein YafD